MTTEPIAIISTSITAAGDQGERAIAEQHVPGSRCHNRRVYREFAPPPELAAHVACVWASVSRGGAVFPDGCVDVVWRGDRVVIAGPATGPMTSDVPVGVRVFGVRFRLGLAGAALGLPAEKFLDVNVPASEVLGPSIDERVAHPTRECRRLAGRTPLQLVSSGAPAAGERWLGLPGPANGAG
jgi:hypothetical protein